MQTQLDENITDFVIDSMVPAKVVENYYFKKIIDDLQVNYKKKPIQVMSRFTLKRRIKQKFKNHISKLKEILNKEPKYVCTIVDIWSSKRRSFLGVTCDWILPKTFKRKSAALACRRFKGTHYDKIAEMLNAINVKYNLEPSKIVAATTDNGSNFVKAFGIFGSRNKTAKDQDDIETEEDEIEENELNENVEHLENDEKEKTIQHIVIDPRNRVDHDTEKEKENGKQLKLFLPHHLRCASHTLNLCATSDVEKTIKNCNALSLIHDRIMKKCGNYLE